MSILHILAGPNGSGKTTFFETAVSEKFIDSALPFINVDLITRNLSGGYTAENFAKADEMALQEISRHINLREDFMIESNLATQRDYDWIDAIKKKGYEIVLYFLCTENIEINFGRV
jgi:predicted ABC-type ATPase